MSSLRKIHLVGYASGIAGGDIGNSANGPFVIQRSPYLAALKKQGIALQWEKIVIPNMPENTSKLEKVETYCRTIANQIGTLLSNNQFFTVIGGDHSSAIGTWSGASHAKRKYGPIGLIWIDAHMDSHTPQTSPSGNIHGMPLACLLGHGAPSLTHIQDQKPKINPEHLCLIGIRNFEPEEAALLKKLNVRIFFMNEVEQRGLDIVMQEALHIVTKGTVGFGISIDIDSIDPIDAPGTGVPEANGIHIDDLYSALQHVTKRSDLLGAEIAEFNPALDHNGKTEKLIASLIASLALKNNVRK